MAWHGDGMEMTRLMVDAPGSNVKEEEEKQEGGRRKEDQRVQRKARLGSSGPVGAFPNLESTSSPLTSPCSLVLPLLIHQSHQKAKQRQGPCSKIPGPWSRAIVFDTPWARAPGAWSISHKGSKDPDGRLSFPLTKANSVMPGYERLAASSGRTGRHGQASLHTKPPNEVMHLPPLESSYEVGPTDP